MSLYDDLMDLVMDDSNNINSLNEVNLVSKDGYKIGIFGDGDTNRGFADAPYVKYYKGDSPRKCEKLVRISLLEPAVVEHEGNNWKNFNKKDIERFVSMMNDIPSEKYRKNDDNTENKSNYAAFLRQIKNVAKGESKIDMDRESPDYHNIPVGNYASQDKKKKK